MKKKFKLGIIGCGAMAVSLVKGAVLSDFLLPKKIILSDIDEKKLDCVDDLGVYTCNSNKFVAENSEFLVFAVKPNNFSAVAKSLSGCRPEKIISVMPGYGKAAVRRALGCEAAKVSVCAPNFPCAIGSGITGVDMSDFNADQDDTEFISKIFGCLGTVLSIDESKFGAVSAIGAGGAVYSLMLIDALADAGVKNGLERGEARALAVQSVLGAAEMAGREEEKLSELVVRASGSCGNFAGAVKILEENGFASTIEKAVKDGVSRFKEV